MTNYSEYETEVLKMVSKLAEIVTQNPFFTFSDEIFEIIASSQNIISKVSIHTKKFYKSIFDAVKSNKYVTFTHFSLLLNLIEYYPSDTLPCHLLRCLINILDMTFEFVTDDLISKLYATTLIIFFSMRFSLDVETGTVVNVVATALEIYRKEAEFNGLPTKMQQVINVLLTICLLRCFVANYRATAGIIQLDYVIDQIYICLEQPYHTEYLNKLLVRALCEVVEFVEEPLRCLFTAVDLLEAAMRKEQVIIRFQQEEGEAKIGKDEDSDDYEFV